MYENFVFALKAFLQVHFFPSFLHKRQSGFAKFGPSIRPIIIPSQVQVWYSIVPDWISGWCGSQVDWRPIVAFTVTCVCTRGDVSCTYVHIVSEILSPWRSNRLIDCNCCCCVCGWGTLTVVWHHCVGFLNTTVVVLKKQTNMHLKTKISF